MTIDKTKAPKMRTCARCGDLMEVKGNKQVCDKEHFSQCKNCGNNFPWSKRNLTCSKECTIELRLKGRKQVKPCSVCGDLFEGDVNSTICDGIHYKRCENCYKEFEIVDLYRISRTCSSSCASTLSHTDESENKRRKNNLEKYGVESVFQIPHVKEAINNSELVKLHQFGGDNFKEQIKEKYGVENVSQSKIIKNKKIKTSLKNYGVENPMYSELVKEKFASSMMEKYGVTNPFSYPLFQQKAANTLYNNANNSNNINKNYGRISKTNRDFAALLKQIFNIECEFEFPLPLSINGIDLKIKNTNILIEINPTITHCTNRSVRCFYKNCPVDHNFMCLDTNEIIRKDHHKKAKNLDYHLNRSLQAIKNNYYIFHIFDFNSIYYQLFKIGELLELINIVDDSWKENIEYYFKLKGNKIHNNQENFLIDDDKEYILSLLKYTNILLNKNYSLIIDLSSGKFYTNNKNELLLSRSYEDRILNNYKYYTGNIINNLDHIQHILTNNDYDKFYNLYVTDVNNESKNNFNYINAKNTQSEWNKNLLDQVTLQNIKNINPSNIEVVSTGGLIAFK